jgi:hypothetical protein
MNMSRRPATLEPDMIMGGVLGGFGFIAAILGDSVESRALMWVSYILAFFLSAVGLYFLHRGWSKRKGV